MKKPLIVANWKLYIGERDEALESAKSVARKSGKVQADIVICPPTPFIESVGKILARRGLSVGAQGVSALPGSKHTGSITASMVASVGALYVIVGHSEQRAHGESEESIRAAVDSALDAKLFPILCVGEQSRDTSSGDHFSVIEGQLRSALVKISPKNARRIIVAYEPVWAIGKRAIDAMSPGELEETVIYIRKILADLLGRSAALACPILYGGSVEEENAGPLMASGGSGFRVGHASVEAASLIAIATAASYAAKKR